MMREVSLLVVTILLLSIAVAKPVLNVPVMLVCFDGLDQEAFDATDLPSLKQFTKEGVRAAWMTPVYPTGTRPNLQTLLTGLYSESHGIVSNNFWDPVLNEYWRGREEPKFFADAEPVWLTYERQGGTSAMYFWPGIQHQSSKKPTYYEPPVNPRSLKIATYGDLFSTVKSVGNRFAKMVTTHLRSKNPPHFIGFYGDFPDPIGHRFGPKSKAYASALKLMDQAFGALMNDLRTAGFYDKLNIILVSDHGLLQVEEPFKVIALSEYIDPTSFFLAEQGVSAHIWPKPGKDEDILRNLTNAAKYVTVYRKNDIPNELHWKKHRRIPPVLVLANRGYQIRLKQTDKKIAKRGEHGYHPDWEEMRTVLLARGPAFKRGITAEPCSIKDVYPLLAHLLNIRPMPHNGSLNLLRQIIKEEYLPLAEPSKGAKAFIKPSCEGISPQDPKIYGIAYFLKEPARNVTRIRLKITGVPLGQKFLITVRMFGLIDGRGCSTSGGVYKYLDVPHQDGSISSTMTAGYEGTAETIFSQRLDLSGPGSVIGRSITLQSMDKRRKILSCGVIVRSAVTDVVTELPLDK